MATPSACWTMAVCWPPAHPPRSSRTRR
jgi:hypothetical protein